MTDKEYKDLKKKIIKLRDKWLSVLGFDTWRIELEFIREGRHEGKTEYAPKVMNDYWESALVTSADSYYKTARIGCYMAILMKADDEDLEEYFVHELMHVMLCNMHTKATSKEEELVATNLAQAFIRSAK